MQRATHSFLAVFFLIAAIPRSTSLGIFAPLYYDPGNGCSKWSAISSAVSAHSGTQFYLVINPSNGPGSTGSQPDQTYNNCVPSLRPSSNPNVVVLGYVDIRSKSSSAVLAEVDTYAGWSSTSRPIGIFFDGTTASSVNEYQSLVSHVKDKGFTFIALGAGETINADYFSLANLVITYESSYSSFTMSDLVISSSSPASKQGVILSLASTIDSYSEMISQLSSAGVGAVYITDLGNSVSGIPQQWSVLVDGVAAVGGQPSNPATTSHTSSVSTSVTPTSLSTQTSSSGGSTATSSSNGSSNTNDPTGTSHSPFHTTSLPAASTVSSSSSQETSPSPGGAVTSSSSSSPPIGAIVGGVLGAIIVILIFILFFMWRRRRQSSYRSTTNPVPEPFPFLSRQPFTLIQSNEKLASGPASPPSSSTTYPPASWTDVDQSHNPPSSTSSSKKYPLSRLFRSTIHASNPTVATSGSTMPRYSVAPPPYRAPSPPPTSHA